MLQKVIIEHVEQMWDWSPHTSVFFALFLYLRTLRNGSLQMLKLLWSILKAVIRVGSFLGYFTERALLSFSFAFFFSLRHLRKFKRLHQHEEIVLTLQVWNWIELLNHISWQIFRMEQMELKTQNMRFLHKFYFLSAVLKHLGVNSEIFFKTLRFYPLKHTLVNLELFDLRNSERAFYDLIELVEVSGLSCLFYFFCFKFFNYFDFILVQQRLSQVKKHSLLIYWKFPALLFFRLLLK